jgi:hypothetical protein
MLVVQLSSWLVTYVVCTQNKITGRNLRICHDYRRADNIKMGRSCEDKNWSLFLEKSSTEKWQVNGTVNQSWGSAKPGFFKNKL